MYIYICTYIHDYSPSFFIDLPIFKNSRISARPPQNFLVHFGGPPRVVPFRDAISIGCYEICGCCDIVKWCQDMTWIIDEDWSRSVLCDTFCGSCIEIETHSCTIHACDATVSFILIQSWLRESLPESSADNAKFFLHPFGFDLRVNASTPGEDIVRCQFRAFFFLPVAIHMSIGWFVRVSYDNYLQCSLLFCNDIQNIHNIS